MSENNNAFKTDKIEYIAFALFIAGYFMKAFHLPFSGPTILIALGTLAIVFVIAGFRYEKSDAGANPDILDEMQEQEAEEQHGPLNIMTGVLLAIACIGILFKLMHWPFSQTYSLIAVLGLPVVFVWMYMVQSKMTVKETAKKYQFKLFRIALFFVLLLVLNFAYLIR